MEVQEAKRAACVAHVRRWQASGLTRQEYCARHDLNVHTFDGWRRRSKTPLTLLPLTVREESPAPMTTASGATIVVRCGNGIRLELVPQVGARWLAELLRGLGAC